MDDSSADTEGSLGAGRGAGGAVLELESQSQSQLGDGGDENGGIGVPNRGTPANTNIPVCCFPGGIKRQLVPPSNCVVVLTSELQAGYLYYAFKQNAPYTNSSHVVVRL